MAATGDRPKNKRFRSHLQQGMMPGGVTVTAKETALQRESLLEEEVRLPRLRQPAAGRVRPDRKGENIDSNISPMLQ